MKYVEEFTQYKQDLAKAWVVTCEYQKMGTKTTVCLIKLTNGFEIVGTSACVDPKDFNKELGEKFALERALEKLGELDGFYKQCK
ncbi:hypothetical protein_gp086 [Bacillus phage vB_BceM_WH1]|nr:hypothetical protein_gp086 [Bacillus phage vB_BceM_WH1]